MIDTIGGWFVSEWRVVIQNPFEHLTMKFISGFCCYFFCSFVVSPVVGVSYKLLKLDKCTTTNEKVFGISTCNYTASRLNITIELKKPLTKFYVSVYNLCCAQCKSKSLSRSSHHSSYCKTPSIDRFSRLHGLSGADSCQVLRRTTIDSSKLSLMH